MDALGRISLRLNWADHHLRQLVDKVRGFLSEQPYSSVSENNPERGEYVARAVVKCQPPVEFSLLTGDCIHNLRSSLDHLVYQLTLRSTASPPDRVGFPIFLCPPAKRSFREEAARSIGTLPEAAKAIIEELQPYKRGDHPESELLWILHDLWNTDKHRTMLLTGASIFDGNIDWMDPGIVTESSYIREGAFQDGDVRAHLVLSSPTNAAPHFQVSFTFDVGFGEPGPAEGMPLTQTLGKMHTLIRDDIVPRFRDFLT